MVEEQCILHWKATPSTEALIPCSTFAYEKIKDFCRSWKWTQSADVAVARRFLAALPPEFAEEVPPLSFHRSCYIRFTNKERLQRAKAEAKRQAKPRPEPEVKPEDSFPDRCIFCHRDAHNCRRKKEPGYRAEALTRCRKPRVAARILGKAAELDDRELLALVAGRDLVDCWAKYHETCYATYVNKYHASKVPPAEWPAMDEDAFRRFVAEEVKPQVRDGRACVAVTAFANLFNETIKSSKHLKSELPIFELRKHCPFLRFTREEDSSAASQGLAGVQQKPQDASAGRGQKRRRDGDADSNHAASFRYAQSLHGKISQVLAGGQEAPPPLELLNFLAACVSGSQLAPDAFTQLPNATRGKVTRIARNLVHLSAEGMDQRQEPARAKAAPDQSGPPAEARTLPETAPSGGIEALAEEWLAMYGLL